MCSKLTMKTPERRQWCRSGVFIVNFEQANAVGNLFEMLWKSIVATSFIKICFWFINPFLTHALILCPLKRPENIFFFQVFSGSIKWQHRPEMG